MTGGASGIGRAIADGLAAEGARVLVADRDAAGLDALPKEFETIEVDLAAPEAPGELGRTAEERLGGVDVLVNNAGYGQVGTVEETTEQETREFFAVHMFGPAALVRAVLPAGGPNGGFFRDASRSPGNGSPAGSNPLRER